jgi:hypothetical protein
VRLTKTAAEYRETRESRKELAYEAMLACGRTRWSAGERVRVYRTGTGAGAVVEEGVARRDYDAHHYARLFRETFAARLASAFTPADYEAVFADPEQMTLFAPPMEAVRTVLEASTGQQARVTNRG